MKKSSVQLLIAAVLPLLAFTANAGNFSFNIDIQNTTGATANDLEMVFSSQSAVTVTNTYNGGVPSYPGFPLETTTYISNPANSVGFYWHGATFANSASAHVGASGFTAGSGSLNFDTAYWTKDGSNIGFIHLANIHFSEGPAWNVVWDKYTDPKTGSVINQLVEIQGDYKNQDAFGGDIQAQYGVVNIGNQPIPLDQLNPSNPQVANNIIWQDINIQAIPEPTEFALMLVGMGLLSASVKSAKRK